MKTLLWKELRQLAPWAAAMLVAMSIIIVASVVSESERHYASLYRQAWFQVWLVIGFGAPCAAFLIGVVQSVLEVRRDQWAFLMHRGFSPTQIFFAKTIAGLSAYAVITLLSAIGGFVWSAWGGVERQLLSWHHLLPLAATFLAAASFYFAALLAVVWRGPWYFSRMVPVASAVLMVMGAIAYAAEVTEFVPVRVFVAIALGVGILGVAAWGVFVRSGESTGRPRAATFCLAIPVFVAVFGSCLALFVAAGAGYEMLARRYLQETWYTRPHTQFMASREGHVLEIVTEPDGDPEKRGRRFSSIIDLDEPESRRYESFVGMSVAGAVPALNEVPMATVLGDGLGPFEFLRPPETPRRIVESLGNKTVIRQFDMNWVYSAPDGWIYGYLEEHELRDGRMQPKPPRLVEVIGPDGFVQSPQRPQRRFGRFLANARSGWDRFEYNAWPEIHKVAGYASQLCLLFDDGLYLIDPENHAVRTVLSASDSRKIRCLAKLGNDLAVVYHDSVDVHASMPVTVGTRTDQPTQMPIDVSINVPGELRYSFPIPNEVAIFGDFSFGRLPDRDSILFRVGGSPSTFDLNRFIEMRLDGAIVNSRDFLTPGIPPTEAIPPFCAVAVFAPPGPLLAAIGVDEACQALAGAAPGAFGRLCRNLPVGMLVTMAILLASALLCGGSAGRTARRYGFDTRTRRIWQWTAALLGPAGLLTLQFLRDWPAMEKCRECGQRRPVDCDLCPHCGAPAAPAPIDGTEILLVEAPEEMAVVG
ncbi:MAG TPA: hypothetical protein VKU82_14185 [Planctomycetaceae bacterium]|nr:hypothetical protein [Planctomycetaceae bacterium]